MNHSVQVSFSSELEIIRYVLTTVKCVVRSLQLITKINLPAHCKVFYQITKVDSVFSGEWNTRFFSYTKTYLKVVAVINGSCTSWTSSHHASPISQSAIINNQSNINLLITFCNLFLSRINQTYSSQIVIQPDCTLKEQHSHPYWTHHPLWSAWFWHLYFLITWILNLQASFNNMNPVQNSRNLKKLLKTDNHPQGYTEYIILGSVLSFHRIRSKQAGFVTHHNLMMIMYLL